MQSSITGRLFRRTAYGDGMVEGVRDIARGSPNLILDTAPISGVLPDLVKIAGGDPGRVLTISDFAAAAELGVRDSFTEGETRHSALEEDFTERVGASLRYDVLGDFAKLAAEGRFTIPIARTFALEDWRQAFDISQSGNAHGKPVLLPGNQN